MVWVVVEEPLAEVAHGLKAGRLLLAQLRQLTRYKTPREMVSQGIQEYIGTIWKNISVEEIIMIAVEQVE